MSDTSEGTMTEQPHDPKQPDLHELAKLANEMGAQGVWIVRGAKDFEFSYLAMHKGELVMGPPVGMNIADAGAIVIMRFPIGDDEGEGIESL